MPKLARFGLYAAGAALALLACGCSLGGGSGWSCDGEVSTIACDSVQAFPVVPSWGAAVSLSAAVDVATITRIQLNYTAENPVPGDTSRMQLLIRSEPDGGATPIVLDTVTAMGLPFPAVDRSVTVTDTVRALFEDSRTIRVGAKLTGTFALGTVEAQEIRLRVCYGG